VSPTRTFAVLLMIAALVCGVLAIRSTDSAKAAGPSIATPGAPAWSARRVPQPIVDAVGAQRLQTALDATAAGTDSCFLVDEGGAPLASHNGDTALVPASTQKLLTASTALAVLGPETTLDTRVMAAQAPEGGTVDRLFLVGGGDPLLVTPDVQALRDEIPELRGSPTTSLAALADAIVAAGVKRIPKGIAADDARYEALRYLPTWKESYRTEGQVGPIGALTVNGGFSALRPKPVPVDDPAVFAAEKLGELLEERGVDIGKSPTREVAPPGAVEVAKVSSPPLADVIGEEISTSDNLGSELLTREIGLRTSQQGTTAAGTAAILAKLGELGVPTANATVVDGSGLDRGNRLTCNLLLGAFELGSLPEYAALWNGLAIAGQRGTLVDQIGGDLTGKVRGKTGSLDGVTGLVGIVDVGRPLRFAFLANGGFTEQAGIALRGRIAQAIATFPDAPSADELVPQPVATAQP
jgi:D-alanyl-D-alanine carboxypeptidase/D-alanyl-D-alanine-endopeptidase (penicillin-binding protein 4)